jgi:hypothetical protein
MRNHDVSLLLHRIAIALLMTMLIFVSLAYQRQRNGIHRERQQRAAELAWREVVLEKTNYTKEELEAVGVPVDGETANGQEQYFAQVASVREGVIDEVISVLKDAKIPATCLQGLGQCRVDVRVSDFGRASQILRKQREYAFWVWGPEEKTVP